jgi:hypothetical protein
MDFSVSEDDTFSTSGSVPVSWIPSGEVWLNIFVQNMSDNTIYQSGSINLGKISNPLPQYDFNLTVSPDTFQTGSPGEYTTFYFCMENNGSEDDDYDIAATEMETASGWSWMLCSGGTCKLPDHGVILDTLFIPSQVVDTFTVEVNPSTTPGLEKINVVVTSFGDPTEADTINVYTEVQ